MVCYHIYVVFEKKEQLIYDKKNKLIVKTLFGIWMNFCDRGYYGAFYTGTFAALCSHLLIMAS